MPLLINKLGLMLLVIAIAAAPLRSALALPAATSADSETHCASMQDAMPGMHHQDDTADAPLQCNAGCKGDCCDNACNSCTHPATALLAGNLAATGPHLPPLKIILSSRFSDRTIIPLLRPPASP